MREDPELDNIPVSSLQQFLYEKLISFVAL